MKFHPRRLFTILGSLVLVLGITVFRDNPPIRNICLVAGIVLYLVGFVINYRQQNRND